MSVCSPAFLAFCCLGPILFHAVRPKLWRQVLFTLFNLGFLLGLVSDWKSWVCLLTFVLGSYGIVQLLHRTTPRFFVLSVIGLFVAAFVLIKRYSFLDAILPVGFFWHPLDVIGLSYILFKVIHVLVDRWEETLDPCPFWSYVNYQLSLFTIIAGPIQRYNDFYRFWEEMGLSPADKKAVLQSWIRLLTGMLKIGVVAALASSAFNQGLQSLQAMDGEPRQFSSIFYGFPIYLYFNFSGYTDVVVGAASLFGFRLPENFNHPYLARNIIDFWNRWHITLTHWIRDYVFMTSYKAVAERLPQYRQLAGYLIAFVALLIAGLWHGAAGGFAFFGAIHGLGIAANQAGADLLRSFLGGAGYRRYQQNGLVRAVAVLATFHYVCFAFLFFSLDSAGALHFLATVARDSAQPGWWPEMLPAARWLLIALVTLAVFFSRQSIFTRIGTTVNAVAEKNGSLYLVLIGEAVFTAGVMFALWAFQQSDPVIVYMKY